VLLRSPMTAKRSREAPARSETEGQGEELEDELLTIALRAKDQVEKFVRQEPHAAIGLAVAAGIIHGGGMTPRRLIRLGLAIGGPAITERLAGRAAELVSASWGRRESAQGPAASP
jgi:hypothetical protein